MKGKKLSAIVAAAIGVSLYGYSVVYAEISTAPDTGKITVANNVGKADTVTVTGVSKDDTVIVYAPDKTTVLGKAKAAGDSVTVSLTKQLAYEKVDVSVTKPKYTESEKVEVNVPAEEKTAPLESSKVKVANNVGKNDIVTVEGLKLKDIVKVYKTDGKTLLGMGKLSKDGNLVISLSKQLTEEKVLITLTQDNKQESQTIEVNVPAEEKTAPLESSKVKVVNNVGKNDIVTITGLKAKDTVKVYKTDGKTVIGTGKLSKDGDVVISLSKQLTEEKILVTLTQDNKQESEKLEVAVQPEEKSKSLLESNIIVVNNVSEDKIIVLGVNEGSTVNVYSSEAKGKALVSGKVAKGQKVAILSTKQLGKDGGQVYISVAEDGKQESDLIVKTFDKE